MTRDAHPHLLRLLRACAGAGARLVGSAATGWTSLTYAGQRHRIVFALADGGEDDRFARFGEGDPELRGHLLVELKEVVRRRDGAATLIELAATTIERA